MSHIAKGVRVLALPRPFHDERVTGSLPAGLSIDEIVGELVQAKAVHPSLIRALRVTVGDDAGNDVAVPYERWPFVRPKDGARVTIKVIPQGNGGGGGGGKSPLRIVLQVIVIIVALVLVYFGQYSAAAAVVSIGMAVINLVAPPPNPAKRSPNQLGSSPLSPPTFAITGTRNQYNPYGAIPRVYGKRRMFPSMAARTYTETAGNDQYVRALFCFGYGPLLIEDITIGTTPISAFSAVEYEVRQGFADDAAVTLFPTTVREEALSVLLAASAATRTTNANTTEIAVDVSFRRGLTHYDASGTRSKLTVDVLVEYREAGSVGDWTTATTISTTDSSASEVRNTYRWTVPKGQYDVRLTRTTAAATDANSVDLCWWSVLRSFTTDNPVNKTGLALIAVRIKANEQLNGTLDTLSAVVTSMLPIWDGAAWSEPAATVSPAWAFADVLRGTANKNPVPDAQIDLAALKEWADDAAAAAPNDPGAMWSYNYVHDSRGTADAILREIAATCRARPIFRDGKYSVVRDILQTTPWQHFTPRNSWGFKSIRPFPQLPHALRVRWINADKDWAEDELLVYADGYSKDGAGGTVAATLFEQVDMLACTTQEQAWREARYHLATATLRPATYEIQTDIEHIVCKGGDLVRVAYDVPMWGLAQGRIEDVTVDGGGNVTGLTLDTSVVMVVGKTYNLRIRRSDNTSLLAAITTEAGTVTVVTPSPVIGPASAPAAGDIFMFGEVGQESVECIVQNIKRGENQTATITLVDAAPLIHDWYSGTMPAFESHISHSMVVEQVVPPTPSIVEVWDRIEWVSGTATPKTYIGIAPFAASVVGVDSLEAQYREVGAGTWLVAPRASAGGPVVIAGLIDGTQYDLRVRSVSAAGVASAWATTTHTQAAAAAAPDDVTGFAINVLGDTAYLSWDAGTDADVSYRRIKFSPDTTGAAEWATAADLIPRVSYPQVSATAPAMNGTYLIKAVDLGGRESAAAAAIINTLVGVNAMNAVQVVTESPTFTGTKTDVQVVDGGLELAPADTVDDWADVDAVVNFDIGPDWLVTTGTYDFATTLDLGATYTSRLTAAVAAYGVNYNNDLDAVADIDGLADWDGVTVGDWSVELQVRTTTDDPGGTPTWGAWATLMVGDYTARAFQWRVVLTAVTPGVTPRVTGLAVTVDMPDRVDGANNVSCPAGGTTVTFSPAFKATPAIGLSAQNMATGDYYTKSAESAAGFTIRFFNSSGTGVARTFDWVARGYGYAS